MMVDGESRRRSLLGSLGGGGSGSCCGIDGVDHHSVSYGVADTFNYDALTRLET